MGGLNRRWDYQSQPPFTSPDCLNVRGTDIKEGRSRIGTRPGLGKAYNDNSGNMAGNPVRLLSSVRRVGDWTSLWLDPFDYQPTVTGIGSWWTQLAGPLVSVDQNLDFAFSPANVWASAVATKLDLLDVSKEYSIGLALATVNGLLNAEYYIYFRMADSSPSLGDSARMKIWIVDAGDGTFTSTWTLQTFSSGALQDNFAGTGPALAQGGAWFVVSIDGSDVTVTLRGASVTSKTLTQGAAGERFGFSLTSTPTTIAYADSYLVRQKNEDDEAATESIIVTSTNGNIFYEADAGGLAEAAGNKTLATDRLLHAVERLQVLFIADNANVRDSGSDGIVSVKDFDDAGAQDWTGVADADDDMLVIESGSAATAGTYHITAVSSDSITLDKAPGDASGVSYSIQRCPKQFNGSNLGVLKWKTDTPTAEIPLGCPLIARYRDRIVLAGPATARHVWFMSRMGNPLDWDFGADSFDPQRAVYGTTADAGLVAQPLTALAPVGDDYLVFGCDEELWVLRGDPAMGGQLQNLSRTIGILASQSWCVTPNNELVFLGADGLYMLPAGAGTFPIPVSKGPLPEGLRNIDTEVYEVQLAFDARDHGVHIFLTRKSEDVGSSARHWFVDWQTKAFWPVLIPAGQEPTALMFHPRTDSVLLGGWDGYIRSFNDSDETDDGTEIPSHAFIGPFSLAAADREGRLRSLVGQLTQDSGPVDWSLFASETAEAVVSGGADARATGIWTAGLNYRTNPRARGASAYLKLENNSTIRAWALERITAEIERAGRQRLS